MQTTVLNMLLPKQSAIFLVLGFHRLFRFEHASTEAICYQSTTSVCCPQLVLNLLLPKQSAITGVPALVQFLRFEPASTEAICYQRERCADLVQQVLNMLLPKQSARHWILPRVSTAID